MWPLLLVLMAPPAPLLCLERHYGARAVESGGRWALELPDGKRLPYDDGRTKTAAERLADPDLEDMFAQRYRRGPIRPVTTADEDPGRVRLEALFRAAYPKAGLLRDRKIVLHRKIIDAWHRVQKRLAAAPEAQPFLARLGGGYAARAIAGTDRLSAHAFGIAIDLDPSKTHYWRWDKPPAWRNTVPQAIVDAFEAEGFIWGGRWYHYDTMHFEFRPELLDERCYPDSEK
jgi:hypothetical protein